MKIDAPCVVSLSWTLTDTQGEVIDEHAAPAETFFGGDDLLPKVEQALAGHEAGHEALLHLEPEHAFGDYRSELVCFESRALFPKEVEVGMHFEGLPQGSVTPGMPADVLYAVTEVYPDHVVLDGNHPLAGIALRLKVKVHAVRVATAEEVESGALAEGGITVLGTASPATQRH